MIYLVPADRFYQTAYATAIEAAIKSLQVWYGDQMANGKSFRLHSPPVEVYKTGHAASWYSTHPNGPNPTDWFWLNTSQDGSALTGGELEDPYNTWVFYIDADPSCGQEGGGTNGAAVLLANDLRGLTGQPNVPSCQDQEPDRSGVCRWIGGLGHELGHAFDLDHPANCPGNNCPEKALMWLGYQNYPDAFLTTPDKAKLSFFDPVQLPEASVSCGLSTLAGGRIPENVPSGNVPVLVRIGTFSSQERITLAIR